MQRSWKGFARRATQLEIYSFLSKLRFYNILDPFKCQILFCLGVPFSTAPNHLFTSMKYITEDGRLEEDTAPDCLVCGDLDPARWSRRKHSTKMKDMLDFSLICSSCAVILDGLSKHMKLLDEQAQLEIFATAAASVQVSY